MKLEDLLKELDPVTIIEFKNYIVENLSNICKSKKSNSSIISKYRTKEIFCNNCGCKLYKNGKTKDGVQKYICCGCKKCSSETTDSIVYKTKLSFDVWRNIIDNLLNGFSIRRIAEENCISIYTSFRIRHKILFALKSFVKSIKLKENSQLDEKYFSINLKGTKPENMPRYSKKRTSVGSGLKGISHHKVCVVCGIDEEDNLIMNIAGLGRCTTNMLRSSFIDKIEKVDKVKADSASAYQDFCKELGIELIAIPSGFHSDGINNISEINGIHSQLETWLSKFRGVSIRHLQEYLNWFVYIFTMKKKFCLSKIKTESYSNIIINDNYTKCNSICNKELPIDLNIAYGEYNYQS